MNCNLALCRASLAGEQESAPGQFLLNRSLDPAGGTRDKLQENSQPALLT